MKTVSASMPKETFFTGKLVKSHVDVVTNVFFDDYYRVVTFGKGKDLTLQPNLELVLMRPQTQKTPERMRRVGRSFAFENIEMSRKVFDDFVLSSFIKGENLLSAK